MHINSIKTGWIVKNVHILKFQNPLQTKFNFHISVCQLQIKNKAYPETLYVIFFPENIISNLGVAPLPENHIYTYKVYAFLKLIGVQSNHNVE